MSFPVIVSVAILLGGFFEVIILYFFMNMLKETGAVRKNFEGKEIPVSIGISFPTVLLLTYFVYAVLGWYDNSYHLFILGIFTICFLGFIDDMLGQRDTMGFKGHFGALFKGRLTTGGLKALGGGMVSLFIAWFFSNTWYDLAINTIILALFTNLLNLFDLRPGRAIKAFSFFLLIILIVTKANLDWLLLAPLLGAILVYFYHDLKAKAMIGDAGSNVLGFTLGFLVISSFSIISKIIALIFLIGIHIYTEKYSITKTIEKYALLRAIDKMGRG